MKMARQMPKNPSKRRSSITPGPSQEQRGEQLQSSISFHIYRVAAMWTRITSRVYGERFGVSVPELRVLRLLAQSSGATNADICQAWSMDKGLCSRTVTALAERGLIVKMSDKADRRLTRLKLSAAGQEAIDQMEPIRRARRAQLRAALESDEYEALFRIFARIEEMLSESELLNERSGSDYYESQVSAYLNRLGVGKM